MGYRRVELLKNGYIFNDRERKLPTAAPSPDNRVIYTIWKRAGGEPLTSTHIYEKLPRDGVPIIFDIFNGNIDDAGQLKVSVSTSKDPIGDANDHFDWKVDLEVIEGGLIEAEGPYLFMAPSGGYLPKITYEQVASEKDWSAELFRKFFIRTANDKYGLMLVEFGIRPMHPNAVISIELLINPGSSRNLEPVLHK